MTVVRAVGFDLDDTLFDHRTSARAGVRRFLEELDVPVTEAALDAWFTAEAEQFERWRTGQVSFTEQRRVQLRTVLPQLGRPVPDDDEALDALFGEYLRAYQASWRLFPESASLLRGLRSQGYRLGLLTNGSEEQQLDKLYRTGLGSAFDAVCISERIGFQKPDPRAFRTLAVELGVDVAECLFVGDDRVRDIDGARAAGMRALQVDHSAGGLAGLTDLVMAALESGST